MSHPRTGACILVDTLVAQGADFVFGVPGESYLAVLAKAYGAYGEMVDATDGFAPALEQDLTYIGMSSLPALIELRYDDANLITPNITLDAIREAAQKT